MARRTKIIEQEPPFHRRIRLHGGVIVGKAPTPPTEAVKTGEGDASKQEPPILALTDKAVPAPKTAEDSVSPKAVS